MRKSADGRAVRAWPPVQMPVVNLFHGGFDQSGNVAMRKPEEAVMVRPFSP